ncbi:kynurenine--oxoglutarate transaminase [Legionella hackeliae]|uniref:pyridoxal phosphate-dependent aminotransferase n=1 Tax=Legionella hackeliae TaxID=449 RepID=UPI000E17A44A|nr:pyridoxal phosphate-dependent aminotransferase [Legionella hackeliae]STX48103.1 kynurenine--oxoglutarate transaminase [Legionella hackeliae]
MFTPEGQPAEKIDKIMLLSMWAKALKNERAQIENSLQAVKKIITAGMGKPTLPISMHTITFLLFYWKYMEEIVKKAMTNLEKLEDEVAIDYGHPQGDIKARETMAKAMTDWYGVKINPEEILFTSGGAGGLRVVFDTLYGRYKQIPNYRIITPFPHYTLYSDYPHHRLHPVDVMKEPGYRLTAEALEKSIQEAYELAQKDGGLPKAVLICNPNNPLGTVISEEEFKKIAQVLRKYPDLHIILDEAYTEMTYVDVPSFYKIAPDLKNRTTVMRSGTKGLSMAGERVAMLLNSDKKFMSELLATNISLCGHAPRSLQMAYAYTMDKLDLDEKNKLRTFYKSKVDYVSERVREMGATMPDAGYKVEGTFYVLADFSDMLGLEIDAEAKRALGETGVISTDEELAYNLLFKDSVMIAPLSYYGTSAEAGIMRITCSDNKEQLCELMDRLESTFIGSTNEETS